MSHSSTPPLVSKMEGVVQSPSSQETSRTPSQCLSHPAILEIRVPAHPGTLTIHRNSMPEQLASVRNSERAPYVHITHSLRQTLITDYTPVQTISEKIDGLKEEIKGKIKHDPELVEHGREMRQVDSFLRLPTISPKVSSVEPWRVRSVWPDSSRRGETTKGIC